MSKKHIGAKKNGFQRTRLYKKKVEKKSRQLPTFPGEPSIIGASELDFRVRNGNGYCLTAMAAGINSLGNHSPAVRRLKRGPAGLRQEESGNGPFFQSLWKMYGEPEMIIWSSLTTY